MIRKLLHTDADLTTGLVRLTLGLVMFPHALQKLGYLGGFGLAGTYGWMTSSLGMPGALAALALAAEILGAAGLIVGFAGRGAAFGIAAVMVGAAVTVHAKVGFFMNWSGQLAGEGYEFHILATVLALVVLVKGSGAFSIDAWLTRRMKSAAQPATALARAA